MIERPEDSYPVKLNLPGDEQVFELFACACGDVRQRIWDGVMQEVADELCNGDVAELTSAVVYGLINYSANITAIPADQWAAIETQTWDGAFKTRIKCDRIEHGLAATWRAYTERFPEGHYLPPADDDDDDEPEGLATFKLARSLLGQRVRVSLSNEADDKQSVAVGRLLSIADSGELIIEDDSGFAHYAWPMLDIVALPDGGLEL